MANRWLRTKYFDRADGATVMEGVRSDGTHMGFASTRKLTAEDARRILDQTLSTLPGPNAALDTEKFKGESGWVEEPDVTP